MMMQRAGSHAAPIVIERTRLNRIRSSQPSSMSSLAWEGRPMTAFAEAHQTVSAAPQAAADVAHRQAGADDSHSPHAPAAVAMTAPAIVMLASDNVKAWRTLTGLRCVTRLEPDAFQRGHTVRANERPAIRMGNPVTTHGSQRADSRRP